MSRNLIAPTIDISPEMVVLTTQQ